MTNFNAAFKAEVARLARKEVVTHLGALRKASAQHRRDIAALKRQVKELERKLAYLERQESRRVASPAPAPADGAPKVRFSPRSVKAHRDRLGLSAANYGRLVGVSGLTIYNWEKGASRPRAKQLAAWAAIRPLGVREAHRRLELLD